MSDILGRSLQQFGSDLQNSALTVSDIIHKNKLQKETLAQTTNTNTFITKLQNQLYKQRGAHKSFSMDGFQYNFKGSGAVYDNTEEIIKAASDDYWKKTVAPGLSSNEAVSNFKQQYDMAFNNLNNQTLNNAYQWGLDALSATVNLANEEAMSNQSLNLEEKKHQIDGNLRRLYDAGVYSSDEEYTNEINKIYRQVDYNDLLSQASTTDYISGTDLILSDGRFTTDEKRAMVQDIGLREQIRLDRQRVEKQARNDEMYALGLDLRGSGQLTESWILNEPKMNDLPALQEKMIGWLKTAKDNNGNPFGISDYWLEEWGKVYKNPLITNEQYSNWMRENTGAGALPVEFLEAKINENRERIVDQNYQSGYTRVMDYFSDRVKNEKDEDIRSGLRMERDEALRLFEMRISSGNYDQEDFAQIAENIVNPFMAKDIFSSDFKLDDITKAFQSNEEEMLQAYDQGRMIGYEKDFTPLYMVR